MPRTSDHIAEMRAAGMSEPAIYRALGYPACSEFVLALGPDPMPEDAVHEAEMCRVVEAVAATLKVPRAEIVGPPRRGDDRAVPRQVAMLIIRETLDGATLMRIGEFFDRDHTTVLHALHRAEALIGADRRLARKVAAVRRCLPSTLGCGCDGVKG